MVELADVEGRTLSAADTAAAKAIRGPTRCSRAKEVLWGLPAGGFYVLPLWCMLYRCLLWLTRQARTLGTTQTLVQGVLDPAVWPALCKTNVPAITQEFMYKALWKKLQVRQRVRIVKDIDEGCA